MSKMLTRWTLLKVRLFFIFIVGLANWTRAETLYNQGIGNLENHFIMHIQSILKNAKTSNEMLLVFSKFNALFMRPKIRGSLQEYQELLLGSVQNDIKKLYETFLLSYAQSGASKLSLGRFLLI